MTIDRVFKQSLKQAIKEGFDHTKIDCLAGCTQRKLTLTEAEGQAGKSTFKEFMACQLGGEWEGDGGWLFGSPVTQRNIGLIPDKLASQRRGLNRQHWGSYHQII